MRLAESPELNELWLHQSDIVDLRQCQEMARHKANGIADPDGDSAMIGSLVHEFIELHLHRYVEIGRWDADLASPALEMVCDKLEELWPTLWRHPHQIKDLKQAKYYLRGCCYAWWNNVLAEIDVSDPSRWLIEQPFEVQVADIRVDGKRWVIHVAGTLDFHDGSRTWDWKTGRYETSNRWEKERYDIQSTIYTYAVAHTLGRTDGPEQFRFAFMPRGKDSYLPCDLERTSDDWDFMIQEVLSWGRMIAERGTADSWPFGPSDWWCSERWCPVFAAGLCRGAFLSLFPDDAARYAEAVHNINTRNQTQGVPA